MIEHPNWKEVIEEDNISGSIMVYDENEGLFHVYDADRCMERFIPASTYKIIHSLIALETGVIPDSTHVMEWDSVRRSIPVWNQDHTFKTAFRNSVVWYYQRIAREVGEERMTNLLKREGYGNRDISDGIDMFWLTGGLRISQSEQIQYLMKLYHNQTGFSEEHENMVKDFMLREETEAYKMYGKTGWAIVDSMNYGWYVGFLEQAENVYYFATQIEKKGNDTQGFPQKRMEITETALQDLGLLTPPIPAQDATQEEE